MAINPNTVNILNIEELNQASSIENDDLLVIGQGIYARKSTVYQLYQKFGLENIEDAIFELQQQQGDVDLSSVLRFVEQDLQESEMQTARNNIGALGVKMSELSSDLSESERNIIRQKISAASLEDLNGAIANKANTDGSNTTGGEWKIDGLENDAVGTYISSDIFSNETIGIIPTDALGSAYGILLMKHGAPLFIAENANPDWDGYIYRAGTPKPGYPGNQQNGNYLIESKHRFRLHKISAPDSTSAGVGYLTVQPFNAIEHSYHRVTISGVEILEIDMKAPDFDEITGFIIARNAIGQKCTVAVSGGMAGVRFTSVSGADFTSEWNKGVFDFYWTGTSWIFGGYSPIEP